jgi:hypothetical protein
MGPESVVGRPAGASPPSQPERWGEVSFEISSSRCTELSFEMLVELFGDNDKLKHIGH